MSGPLRALCAVDLEDGDVRSTLARAGGWLTRLGARGDLLYVDPLAPVVPADATPELERLLEAARDRRDGSLAQRLTALQATWPAALRGQARVTRDGRLAEAIVAGASGYDLVLLGTRGLQGVERVWLGSVAEKVVRTSPVPVLVLRDVPEQADPGRVLLAVDAFDDGSAALVAEAGLWARRLGAKLDLAHAVAPVVTDAGMVGAAWGTALAELLVAAETRLAALVEALPDEVRGRTRVLRGEPAPAVAQASAEHALVMVGTHGRRGLARAWFGSVAEPIVRRAAGPVLVLRR
jgi:nucleotide-binding universal stress UspA family protein